MGNDKEKFTHETLEKMDKDEPFTENEVLKKAIQKTHDKETSQYIKDNKYKKDITIFNNNDINKKMLDKEDIHILNNANINKYKK
ncbi:hypothetical protein [Clostridium psychrophilum]|uniref:hypothetical protein n=1 Tax=Clostridium psychrophilum TaxID=132926 RepID=UPI001C0E2FB2|nr:hypothetical protein [Clostridium psychrophilum]MBU3182893.1 hypothetical protein [Clostridium psychrophilum]